MSENVKRYHIQGYEWEDFEAEDGSWVKSEDVDALLVNLVSREEEIAQLKQALTAVKIAAALPRDTPDSEVVAHLQRVAQSHLDHEKAQEQEIARLKRLVAEKPDISTMSEREAIRAEFITLAGKEVDRLTAEVERLTAELSALRKTPRPHQGEDKVE